MKENDNAVGKDEKQEFEGTTALKPDIIGPIKCKKCNKVMTTQVSDLEYVLHCQPCHRAVVVSDWETNSKLVHE
jgi:hypothetical protein